jgi:hypothetical protein
VACRYERIDRTLKKQIEGHLQKIKQQSKEVITQRAIQSLTPLALENGSKAFVLPKASNIIDDYLVNFETIRNAKRKLLALRDEQQSAKETAKDENLTHKRKASSREKNDAIQAVEPTQKKSKVHSIKLENKRKNKSRPNKGASDHEDIIEDFVVD